MNSDLVIYLHIFRCGGSSIHEMLKRAIGNEFSRVTLEQIVSQGVDRHDQIRVLHGHFPWGIHRFVNRPYQYATILRHPVDRRISSFFGGKNNTNTLGDFVEVYRAGKSPGNSNIATRLIGGTDSVSLLEQGYYKVVEIEPDLDRAKEHLCEMAFVGVYDYYEESIQQMKRMFGWPEFKMMRDNYSSRRPALKKIPLDVVQVIEEIDNLDLELYRLAKELWKS